MIFAWILLYMVGKRLEMGTAYWVIMAIWIVVWIFTQLLKHAQEG